MSDRAFRTPESFYAESVTREMLVDYLTERGFTDVQDNRKFHGKVESQTIHATAPTGERLVIRVRLCWRRRNASETYSAAQLLPKVKNEDWVGTLQAKVSREVAEGITHSLFVQRELNNTISHAALVPQRVLVEIWCAQRDISSALIAEGRLGRRKKSHAMNGASPTLWLNDEHAPKVIEALWKNPQVLDLNKLPRNIQNWEHAGVDDTFDDLPGMDYSLIGSDESVATISMKSNIKRDPRVRKAVALRAGGRCERVGCGANREFSGFLDVHHILGIEKSDRYWNCVALCPNCHREAHAAPNRDEINACLLEFALQYNGHGQPAATAVSADAPPLAP
ncbi:MAG: endonuclease [Geobacter sp.]|nr:MAG: endonuclease [Geobacter sp.]